jgi:hypothetical protein
MRVSMIGIEPMRTAHEVMEAMRRRYPSPEYAILENVPNAVGGGSRRADALIMGLWRSRGIDLSGFEIKVSRSDVLRELRDPAKADTIADYCDFWWLVVGDPKIAKVEEVPGPWGLLVADGSSLVVAKKAERLPKPKPIDRRFLAAILRVTVESYGSEEMRRDIRTALYEEVNAQAEAAVRDVHAREVENLRRRAEAAEAKVAALAAASELRITPETIGRAIALMHRIDGWGTGSAHSADHAARSVETAIRELTGLRETMTAIGEFAGALKTPPAGSMSDE